MEIGVSKAKLSTDSGIPSSEFRTTKFPHIPPSHQLTNYLCRAASME